MTRTVFSLLTVVHLNIGMVHYTNSSETVQIYIGNLQDIYMSRRKRTKNPLSPKALHHASESRMLYCHSCIHEGGGNQLSQ